MECISSRRNDLIGNIAVALSSGETVPHVLGLIGEYFGVSRVYVYEDPGDGMRRLNTFEWRASDEAPRPERELSDDGPKTGTWCELTCGNTAFGLIGCDGGQADSGFTETQTSEFALAARLIGAHIAGMSGRARSGFSDDFKAALDCIASAVYILDYDTHEILFCNKATRGEYGDGLTGKLCHKVFMESELPCPGVSGEGAA